MPDQKHPDESNSVLGMEGVYLPEDITDGILEQSSDVLKSSPLLSHVSWLSCCVHKLSKVPISFLGKSPKFEIKDSKLGYLPIMSALSLMLGTPKKRPWIPLILYLK